MPMFSTTRTTASLPRLPGAVTNRAVRAVVAIALVVLAGTIGYAAFGFGLLDAVYQTVITVTTVGFNEVRPLHSGERIFTIALIVFGTGTVLYALGTVFESVLEGHLRDQYGRRRMQRLIDGMNDHVIVCGWGRVGSSFAQFVGQGRHVVVIDNQPERLATAAVPGIVGDVTEDDVLRQAGIDRARALVAALD